MYRFARNNFFGDQSRDETRGARMGARLPLGLWSHLTRLESGCAELAWKISLFLCFGCHTGYRHTTRAAHRGYRHTGRKTHAHDVRHSSQLCQQRTTQDDCYHTHNFWATRPTLVPTRCPVPTPTHTSYPAHVPLHERPLRRQCGRRASHAHSCCTAHIVSRSLMPAPSIVHPWP